MRNLPKAGMFVMALGVVAIGAMIFINAATVEARPQYLKAFKDKYGDDIKKANCNLCHPTKDKKERNTYGKAFGKVLDAKNVKDATKLEEALDKVSEEKNEAKGKTFGELIKEGIPPSDE